jgi:major membrane immunogen (membrane-anchored lipoprotein)
MKLGRWIAAGCLLAACGSSKSHSTFNDRRNRQDRPR